MADDISALKKELRALKKRVTALEAAEHGEEVEMPQPKVVAAKTPVKRKEQSGNVLGWIGGIVLALGFIFLVSYAFEQGWVSKAMQIVSGVLAGIVIASAGHWLHKKMPLQGSLLSGVGVGLTYFSIYTGYAVSVYRDAIGLSFPIAVGLLILALLGGAWLALKQESGVLLVEVVALAHITTLLGAFTWLTVLYAVLVIAVFAFLVATKDWEIVGWYGGGISFFFSLLLLPRADLQQSAVYVFGLFIAFTYLSVKRKNQLGQILTLLGAYIAGLVVTANTTLSVAWLTLGTACLAGLLYMFVQNRGNVWYLVCGVSFFALWVPLELQGMLVSAVWAVLVLLLGYITAEKQPILATTATVLSGLLLGKLLLIDSWNLASTARIWSYLIAIIVFLVLWHVYKLYKRSDGAAFLPAAGLLAWLLISIELSNPWMTALLAVLATGLCLLGERKEFFEAQISGLVAFGFLGMYVLEAIFTLHGSTVLLAVLIPVAGAFFISYRYALLERYSTHVFYIGGVTGLVLLVSDEASRLWITLLWAGIGLVSYVLGLQTSRPVPKNVGLVVLTLAIGKLFIIDTLTLSAGLRIIAYLVLGALLLGASIFFAKRK